MKYIHYKPGTGLSIKQYYALEDELWNNRTVDNTADELLDAIYDFYQDLKATKNSIFKDIEQSPEVKQCRVYDFEPGTGKGERQFYKYVKAIGHNTVDAECLSKEKIITIILTKYFDDIE